MSNLKSQLIAAVRDLKQIRAWERQIKSAKRLTPETGVRNLKK